MKTPPIFIACLLALSPVAPIPAADEAASATASSVDAELQALVARVKEKLKSGAKASEGEFSKDLAGFDEIVERNKAAAADDLAQVLIMKGAFYLQVLDMPDKAVAIFEDIEKKYPKTEAAEMARKMISAIGRQEAAAKVQAALKPGAVFPPFEEKDMNGKPLSLAAFKGKVVLVDFWATWCPPCVAEMPNVVAAYGKYHDKGFDIVGISLDESRPELESFLKKNDMTWPQYFDGKGWENVLADRYGIRSIPATFLLDREGRIIGRDLRGEALEKAVAKALGEN
jgi:thiol-disulfide isomerase/thioredoxin